MGEITPEDAWDMLDYYATMDKEKQKYIMQNNIIKHLKSQNRKMKHTLN